MGKGLDETQFAARLCAALGRSSDIRNPGSGRGSASCGCRTVRATTIGTTAQTYDGAGNLTSPAAGTNYEYSGTNQLVKATANGTQILTAAYDTADQTQPRTINETVSGTTTSHVFTQTALGVSSVLDNGTTRTSVSRDPDGGLITLKAGNTRYNLITDYQGSVLGMVDTSGTLAATYTYTPYGAATATGPAAGANPFRYLGGYQLRNGLHTFGHRYYNSNWGRFTAPDPTGQERNTYAYAVSDPINNSDLSGADSEVGGLIGTTVGLTLGAALTVACPATAGLGCVGATAVVGGLTGGAGAALGTKIGGGNRQQVNKAGLLGSLSGAWKGASRLGGLAGKILG
ncbi:RHS repeat-associated core domain-containing protein [Actinokineospora sp. G85]|uniref:RHS repeat-associated core domain-containing protein n=1 Tax=Actinokineospora sp. G85 TaxID=3406626 RepID=UPI003C754199